MLSSLHTEGIDAWAKGYRNTNDSSALKRIESGSRYVGCDSILLTAIDDFPASFRFVLRHQRRRRKRPVAYYKSTSRTLMQLQQFAASIGYAKNDCLTPEGQLLLRRKISHLVKQSANAWGPGAETLGAGGEEKDTKEETSKINNTMDDSTIDFDIE